MDNIFFSTTVHLSCWPPKRVEDDPAELHTQQEAIQKMHHFCHEIYHIPITWITSYGALMQFGSLLKEFCEKYGDEVGIMEYGIYSADVVEDKAHIYQGWVEELGMTRPGALGHKEDEVPGILTWYAMNASDQKKAITYLKQKYEEVLGTEVVTFASPFFNNDTIKILKELDFACIWGTNWNYFCEGMDHKGSSPHPFYRNVNEGNSPETCEADKGPLAIPWGTNNMCVGYNVDRATRRLPSWCTNPMEMANRSGGLDHHFFEKCVKEHIRSRAYNPFVYLPIQLEAVWMDEGPMVEGYIDQYPDYALKCTEAFYHQIETCLAAGAKCLTQKDFAAWHAKEIGKTSEYILYSEQQVPSGLRLNGKDGEYDPILLFANDKGQYVFSKTNGINYSFKWLYQEEHSDIREKAFGSNAPKVQLQNNYSIKIYAGIQLSDVGAEYRIEGLDFSSYTDYNDYAGIIWTANIPEYVNKDNAKTVGLKDFRLLKNDDIILFFADMKEGDNHFSFSSAEPSKYIRITEQGEVGSHYEIWIQNSGAPVKLSKLMTNIGAGRQIGAFWWNGEMHHGIDKFDHGIYDQHTGEFCIGACYPAGFSLRTGYNRLTLELF